MKTIQIILVCIVSFLALTGLGYLINKDKLGPKIMTASEYCQSQGYDMAISKDGVGKYKRVMCFKDRYQDKGYMWFQYPPKSDLENYCQGNL